MKRFFAVITTMFLVLVALLPSAYAGGDGGGSVGDININNLLVRQIVEEQVRQRVSRLESSLWNSQNNYWASSEVNADGWADLIIKDPVPGAYTSYVSGQEYNEILGQNITRLTARNEIVISKGANKFTPELTLSEWQDVIIKLPSKYTGSEEYFDVSFIEGGGKNGTSFRLSSDRQFIHGMISLNATSDVSVMYDGRKYAIPLAFFFGAIGENNAMALESFKSEVLTTMEIKASVMENYLVVPTEAPTIKVAMQYATAGMTVLVKDGHYKENFTMKSGVRLYGNPSCPECVVIESDQYSTIYGEKGTYEIVGVTVKNTCTEERFHRAGAIMIEMANVKMRHVIIESTGTRGAMSPSQSILDFSNVTLVGNGSNDPFDGQPLESGDSLVNLLLYKFANPYQRTEKATIKNSLFWQTPIMADDGSNVAGDPMFLPNYGSGVRPNINSPAVQQIISQSGNYPGAVRPKNPW